MIPQFPIFKGLTLEDREEVSDFVSSRLPYSDFNFTSLWCWNTFGQTKVSWFNGNLVLKIGDYLTDKKFYTFIGESELNQTAEKLLELSKRDGVTCLKFIPEEIVKVLDPTFFKMDEDPDHFDYILDNQKMIDYRGSALHNHANFKKRFSSQYGDKLRVEQIGFETARYQDHIQSLNDLWVKNRIIQNKDIVPELEDKAIRKMFELAIDNDNFCLMAIYYNEQIIAFTIDELLSGDYSLRHFMKADINYKGIYSYLVSESSKMMFEKGKIFTNIEQDLGLKGLRQAKRSYAPANYFKKYTVSVFD